MAGQYERAGLSCNGVQPDTPIVVVEEWTLRVLILSDIHANLEALTAVLEAAESQGVVDEIWCLGDTVGYGPDPVACIELLRDRPNFTVAGNHDLAAIGRVDVDLFNNSARLAAQWSGRHIGGPEKRFLSSLPVSIKRLGFTMVHGTLRDPIMEYLIDPESAVDTFRRMETPYCTVGHSHIPFLSSLEQSEDGVVEPRFAQFPEGEIVPLGLGPVIVNPGSVGQPRDSDPRASYVVYDSDSKTVQWHRVTYDIPRTQQKIRNAGLPEPLARRLEQGL